MPFEQIPEWAEFSPLIIDGTKTEKSRKALLDKIAILVGSVGDFYSLGKRYETQLRSQRKFLELFNGWVSQAVLDDPETVRELKGLQELANKLILEIDECLG